jgi:acyl-CoA synthetase (AMP-forming)/AMP-acid ligase II
MPGRELSFREADLTSRRVAKELLEQGVTKGTRVALQMGNSIEWIVAFYAVVRIGAIAVPLSTAYKPRELATSLRHSDASILIFPNLLGGKDHAAFIESALPGLTDADSGLLRLLEAPYLRTIRTSGEIDRPWARPIYLGIDSPLAPTPDIGDAMFDAVEAEANPADLAMLVYTSGTTAEPKGVMHTHGSWIRHNENLSRFNGFKPDRVTYAANPWFWIGGLGLGIGCSLARGFPLLCMNPHEPAGAFDLMEQYQATELAMWPHLAKRFMQQLVDAGKDLSRVPALDAMMTFVGDPQLRHNSLGQTESFGPHTAAGGEVNRELPDELRGSFGFPVPHLEHRIVDPTTGRDVAGAESGEVIVRGYSLSAGLYKRERHEAFDDDGWLHTGDRGHFIGDVLIFTGRITEMIKTSGSNVAPREVEVAIEKFPAVSLAVVLGVPDPERGEAVGAVVAIRDGATIDVDALRAALYEVLSNYKVPRYIVVVPQADVPTLGSGKPDKRMLREWLVKAAESS